MSDIHTKTGNCILNEETMPTTSSSYATKHVTYQKFKSKFQDHTKSEEIVTNSEMVATVGDHIQSPFVAYAGIRVNDSSMIHIITAIISHLTGHSLRAKNTKKPDGAYATAFILKMGPYADQLADILDGNMENLINGKCGWGLVKQQVKNEDEDYPHYDSRRTIESRPRTRQNPSGGPSKSTIPVQMVKLYHQLKFLLEQVAFKTYMCQINDCDVDPDVSDDQDEKFVEPKITLNEDGVEEMAFDQDGVCTYHTDKTEVPNEELGKFVKELYAWTIVMCGSVGKNMVVESANVRKLFIAANPRGVVNF